MTETDAQRALREDVGDEIEAVFKKHNVGGLVVLVSKDDTAWRFVFPSWSVLQPEGENGVRFRVKSTEPDAHANAESTMHLIGSMRDITRDFADRMGSLFDPLVRAIEKAGGEVRHKAFGGEPSRRPNRGGGFIQ